MKHLLLATLALTSLNAAVFTASAEAQFRPPLRPSRPGPGVIPGRQEPQRPFPGRGRPEPLQPQVGPIPVDLGVQVLRMTGTGCPGRSAVATLSQDGSSVSILFDKMATELAAGSPSLDRKTCMVQLGIKFTGPYRVAIVGSDARGFVSVPQGGQSTISIQHYSYVQVSPRILQRMNLTENFVGPRTEDVSLHSDFRDVPLWSYCGSQMPASRVLPLMTISMIIESSNSSPTENLIASLDSLDIGGPATLTYQLVWTQDTRSCPR